VAIIHKNVAGSCGESRKKKKSRFSREFFSKKQGIYDRIMLFQNIFGTKKWIQ
jgi:hypothetical protein